MTSHVFMKCDKCGAEEVSKSLSGMPPSEWVVAEVRVMRQQQNFMNPFKKIRLHLCPKCAPKNLEAKEPERLVIEDLVREIVQDELCVQEVER